ncbi:MAG: Phosphatidylinositol-4-phosphate 5-kinase, partial [Chaenotheca gracillima]
RPQAMSPQWEVELAAAITLGIVSHLTIFIHSELDRFAAIILAGFVTTFAILVAILSVQERSLIGGLMLATILFAAFQSALGLSIVIYRLFFHRIAPFPGPAADAVSKWRAARRAQTTEQYRLELARLHARYGDYVRIGE